MEVVGGKKRENSEHSRMAAYTTRIWVGLNGV